jgi:hypothetical protein
MVAISSPGPDRLTRLLALQDGAITASQVRQLGVSHDAIEARGCSSVAARAPRRVRRLYRTCSVPDSGVGGFVAGG